MKIIAEWNTVTPLGQCAELRIVRYEHNGPLYFQIKTKVFSEVEIPSDFFERCRVHNVIGGGGFVL